MGQAPYSLGNHANLVQAEKWSVRVNFGPISVTDKVKGLGYFNDTGMNYSNNNPRYFSKNRGGEPTSPPFKVDQKVRIRVLDIAVMALKQETVVGNFTREMGEMTGRLGVVTEINPDGFPVIFGNAWHPELLEHVHDHGETNDNRTPAKNDAYVLRFGWTRATNSQYTRDRLIGNRANRRGGAIPPLHLRNDLIKRTITHLRGGGSRSWKIKLPPGRYKVAVTVGDPSFASIVNLVIKGANTTTLASGSKELGVAEFATLQPPRPILTADDGTFILQCTSLSDHKRESVKLVSAVFSLPQSNYELHRFKFTSSDSDEVRMSSFVSDVAERLFANNSVDSLLGLKKYETQEGKETLNVEERKENLNHTQEEKDAELARQLQEQFYAETKTTTNTPINPRQSAKSLFLEKIASSSVYSLRSRQGLDITSGPQQNPLELHLDETTAGISRTDGGLSGITDQRAGLAQTSRSGESNISRDDADGNGNDQGETIPLSHTHSRTMAALVRQLAIETSTVGKRVRGNIHSSRGGERIRPNIHAHNILERVEKRLVLISNLLYETFIFESLSTGEGIEQSVYGNARSIISKSVESEISSINLKGRNQRVFYRQLNPLIFFYSMCGIDINVTVPKDLQSQSEIDDGTHTLAERLSKLAQAVLSPVVGENRDTLVSNKNACNSNRACLPPSLLYTFQCRLISSASVICNENLRAHLRDAIGDLSPSGCIPPKPLSSSVFFSSVPETSPCDLLVVWSRELFKLCEVDVVEYEVQLLSLSLSASFAESRVPRLHLARFLVTALLLMADELWVAAHLVRPAISLTGKLANALRNSKVARNTGSISGEGEVSAQKAGSGSESDMHEALWDFFDTLTLFSSHLSTTLIRGNPVSTTEQNLRKWSRSTLFIGGQSDAVEPLDGLLMQKGHDQIYPPEWIPLREEVCEQKRNVSEKASKAAVGLSNVISRLQRAEESFKSNSMDAWEMLVPFMKKSCYDVPIKGRIKFSFYKIDPRLKKHNLVHNSLDRLHFAALIKHGGPHLWKEVACLLSYLEERKLYSSEPDSVHSEINISEDLNSAWLEVLRLRQHIEIAMKDLFRQAKGSNFIEAAAESKMVTDEPFFPPPPPIPLSSPMERNFGPTVNPSETLRQGSEGFRRRLRDLQRRRKPRRVYHPKTIETYEGEIKKRISFLLATEPAWLVRQDRFSKSKDEDNTASAMATKFVNQENILSVRRQLSQASSQWNKSESIVSRETLAPLKEHWNSSVEMQGVELLHKRWGEVMGMFDGGSKTGGVYGIVEETNLDTTSTTATNTRVVNAVDVAPDTMSRSPQSKAQLRTASFRDDITSDADFMFAQVRLYVGDGSAAPPELLLILSTHVKRLRACCRELGFKALTSLLGNDGIAGFPHLLQLALEQLRSSLCGCLEPFSMKTLCQSLKSEHDSLSEKESDEIIDSHSGGESKNDSYATEPEEASSSENLGPMAENSRAVNISGSDGRGIGQDMDSSDLSLIRHHHMKFLCGISGSLSSRIQGAFINLYAKLANLLLEAYENEHYELCRTILWSFALDYLPSDSELLLRTCLPAKLTRIFIKTEDIIDSPICEQKQDISSSAMLLFRLLTVCAIGGRKGFFKGNLSRQRMMRRAMQVSVNSRRNDLVEPAVRLRLAINDGELVKSVEGILQEPEDGAEDCLQMNLLLQSQLLGNIQTEIQKGCQWIFSLRRDYLLNASEYKSVSLTTFTDEMKYIENRTYQHLAFMLSVIDEPASQLHLTVGFLMSMFILQKFASPRIARVCTLLMSKILMGTILNYKIVLHSWVRAEKWIKSKLDSEHDNMHMKSEILNPWGADAIISAVEAMAMLEDKKSKSYRAEDENESSATPLFFSVDISGSDLMHRFVRNVLSRIGKGLQYGAMEKADECMREAYHASSHMASAASNGIQLQVDREATDAESEKSSPPVQDADRNDDRDSHQMHDVADNEPDASPPRNLVSVSTAVLSQVTEMGIPEHHAVFALRKYNNDIQQAVTWLMSCPHELENLDMEYAQSLASTEAKLDNVEDSQIAIAVTTSQPSEEKQQQQGKTGKNHDLEKDKAEEGGNERTRDQLITQIVKSSEAWESLRTSNYGRKSLSTKFSDLPSIFFCENTHGLGSVVEAHIDELIVFIRKLYHQGSSSQWKTVIDEELHMSLASGEESRKVANTFQIAALACIGGHTSSIRVGSRVNVKRSTGLMYGTIIRCGIFWCDILFDGAIDVDRIKSNMVFPVEIVSPCSIDLDLELCFFFESVLVNSTDVRVPKSDRAKKMEESMIDLKRLNEEDVSAVPASVDRGTLANGSNTDLEHLTDENTQDAILKAYAARALMIIARSPESAQILLQPECSLIPKLLRAHCTKPVSTLADTVELNFLEQHRSELRCLCTETRTGAIIPLDANPPIAIQEKPMSEIERSRQSMAKQLMSMQIHSSKEMRLYLHAIKENDDDFNRSLDWFLSGAADAALQGDVLASKTSAEEAALYPKSHIERWEQAHQIAQMVGMPAKMCFQFLEVSNGGDMNTAASLVMQYGMKHLSGLEKDALDTSGDGDEKHFRHRRFRNLIDDSQCLGVDDSAPLTDMSSLNPGIRNEDSSASSPSVTRNSTLDATSSDRILDYTDGISNKMRERMFQSICNSLQGMEFPVKYLKVSELPSTTVAMSESRENMVSADSLLPGQRIIIQDTLLSVSLASLQNCDGAPIPNFVSGVIVAHTILGDSLRAKIMDKNTGISYMVNVNPAHQNVYAISELAGRKVTALGHVRAALLSTEQALSKLYSRHAIKALFQCQHDRKLHLNTKTRLQAIGFEKSTKDEESCTVASGLAPFKEMADLIFHTQNLKLTPSRNALQHFLRFLKLSAASENIFTHGASLFPHLVKTPITDFLRKKLKVLISNEVKDLVLDQTESGASKFKERTEMSKILISECIDNLKDSTTPGPGTKASTRDSLHPVFPRCDYIDSVFMDGAKMLWVLFDPRCEITHNTTLSFYLEDNPNCRGAPLAQFSGNSSQFMPFVVPGSKIYFRFTSNQRISNDEEETWGCGWGYRFQVRPLRGLSWTCEMQTCNPSLEWACWLLEFLLNDVADLGTGIVHNQTVFNAMVAYLRAKGTPYKHRIIALLTQMLRSPRKFARGEVPDTRILHGIEKAVFDWCKDRQSNSESGRSSALPMRVLQLVEMSVVSRVSADDFKCIQQGKSPRIYGIVDPSSNPDSILPAPEPCLVGENSDPGMILFNIVRTTDALYGRTRLPDDLMNRAILQALGVDTSASASAHELLDDSLMRRAIVMNAWWDDGSDEELIEFATKSAHRIGKGSPLTLDPSVLLEESASWQNDNQPLSRKARKARRKARNTALAGFPKMLSEYSRQQGSDPEAFFRRDEKPWLPVLYSRTAGGLKDAIVDPGAFSIRLRFAILRQFNVDLQQVVSMINLLDVQASWSIGYKINALTNRIFLGSKLTILQNAIAQTMQPGYSGLTITLDNNIAFSSQNRAERFAQDREPAVSNCLFAQLCAELNDRPVNILQHKLDEKGRLFYVNFKGDAGTDWGGIYRETLARATSDLFASYFLLNVPCPNRIVGQAVNSDRYLPNPCQNSPSALKMFEFVGKLMGIAVRTKNYLEMQYAPLIWKKIVGQVCTGLDGIDFLGIDSQCANFLLRVRDWNDPETFDLLFESAPPGFAMISLEMKSSSVETPGTHDLYPAFVVPDTHGSSIELVTGGLRRRLTFEDRVAYVKLAFEYRLSEFDAQCNAIRRGLVSMIPQRALQLFTGIQLETLVCGNSQIEVAQLKKHATYHGWESTSPGVQRFWRAFERLSYKERSGLVRFAWGRSRLPKEADWSTHGQPFKLTKKSGGDAAGYPLAHTCFFQLEVPEYSSDDVAVKRLQYVATVAASEAFGFA